MKRILFLILFIFGVQGVFAQNVQQNLYEQNVKSILLIETQSAKGTGIVLNSDGTVLTAFHVISNADYINIKTKDGREFFADGYKYLSPKDDIAVLTIKQKNSSNSKKTSRNRQRSKNTLNILPVKIDENQKISVGEDIYTISNPAGLDFVFQKGMINRINEDEIQFSAPTSSGSSGGALFDSKGNLVGMIYSQYSPSKAQNINFAMPVSKFLSHVSDKKKANSKNLSWSEFVSEKLSDKELEEFIDYAESTDNISMLYKYFKQYAVRGDVPSYRYALMGTLAISGFLDDGSGKEYLIGDAKKWFALSILSSKNVEASSYGLLLTSVLLGERDDLELIYSYLKKYPATVRKSAKQLDNIIKCGSEDGKCIRQELFSMCRYLQELTGRGY